MKVCSLCQREFDDQQQFCTRDGTKLTRIQERGYCRRCGKDYPLSLNKCPLHETPLADHGPRTILGDNFCHLCDSDFPKAFKLCPVHGIALQTSPLKKKLRSKIDSDEKEAPSKVIEANSPDTNPLPALSVPGLEKVWRSGDLPQTDALVLPDTVEVKSVEPVSGATRELDAAIFAGRSIQDDVEPPKTDQIIVPINAKSRQPKGSVTPKRNPLAAVKLVNRRHVVPTVVVLLALIVSVGAYNVYVRRSAEESIHFSGQGAERQPESNQAKKTEAKPDNGSNDQSKITNKPPQSAETVAANSAVGAVTNVPKNSVPVVVASQPEPRKAQSKKTGKPDPAEPEDATPSDKTRPIFIPKAQDPPVDPPHKEDPKSNVTAKEKKPEIHDVFEQVTPSRPDTARVVASVRNRRRVAVPGGFHYYFEVVLTEVNGIGVNWENGTIERTSESGFATTKSAGYDFALAAHGHVQIRIDVDMLGSTTREWKGTVVYSNKGLDENGHVVRVKYKMPLDESFKD